MPGRNRRRRLNLVDENGRPVDPNGNPLQQDAQQGGPQQGNQGGLEQNVANNIGIGRPADDIEGPHINVNDPFGIANRQPANEPVPTHREYIDQLKVQPYQASVVANMLATSMAMSFSDPDSPIDKAEITKSAKKLMKQPAFKEMMLDIKTVSLAREGKGSELVELMYQKHDAIEEQNKKYRRPKKEAESDRQFLDDVKKSLNDGEAGKKPAELEAMNKYYIKMQKQIDYAQMKAEQGLGLSGSEARKLIDATKKYITNGAEIPGGKQPAAYKQAMCTLHRYLPQEEFKTFCDELSQNPNRRSRRPINPNNFTYARLIGAHKTPKEMREEYGERLKRNPSKENFACILAIRNLSKGKSTVLSHDAIEAERDRLLKKGSAFNKAWDDPQVRDKYKAIARDENYALLGKEMHRDSSKHLAKSSQAQINRSIRTMVSEGRLNQYFSTEHIANILAAKDLAQKADPGTMITNKQFKEHMEMFRKDPFVIQMGARYATDPSFRRLVNHQLSMDNSGASLQKTYENMKDPLNRQAEQNAAEQEQPQRGQPQNQRGQQPQPVV